MSQDNRPSLPLRSGHGATSLFLNRQPVDWTGKQPSRVAYADWVADSLPAAGELRPTEPTVEIELEEMEAAE
jgi:hypothetical protein